MISEHVIGRFDGSDVVEVSLSSDLAEVKLLNFGCVIRDWRVKNAAGDFVPVLVSLDDYLADQDLVPFGGAIVGRYGNRIAQGKFTLEGTEYVLGLNDGNHHLHGGPKGFGKRIWDHTIDHDANAITFTLHSEDGDQGYPGNVEVTVTIRLVGTTLHFDMSATTDAPTPINLAQHNYYNLNGEGDVFDHVLHIAADHYTPTDPELIPTGEILPVSGSLYDFSTPTTFAETDPNRIGVDGNLVLNADRDLSAPAAIVTSEKSRLKLQIWTDQPGLQIFNASWMDVKGKGLDGRNYVAFGGLCLEPQHYPDSVNNPDWPSTIATPASPYHQMLKIDIAPF